MSRSVQCPNCGCRVDWNSKNRFRPFCSERCRMVDLAEWVGESRRIPGETDVESAECLLDITETLSGTKHN